MEPPPMINGRRRWMTRSKSEPRFPVSPTVKLSLSSSIEASESPNAGNNSGQALGGDVGSPQPKSKTFGDSATPLKRERSENGHQDYQRQSRQGLWEKANSSSSDKSPPAAVAAPRLPSAGASTGRLTPINRRVPAHLRAAAFSLAINIPAGSAPEVWTYGDTSISVGTHGMDIKGFLNTKKGYSQTAVNSTPATRSRAGTVSRGNWAGTGRETLEHSIKAAAKPEPEAPRVRETDASGPTIISTSTEDLPGFPVAESVVIPQNDPAMPSLALKADEPVQEEATTLTVDVEVGLMDEAVIVEPVLPATSHLGFKAVEQDEMIPFTLPPPGISAEPVAPTHAEPSAPSTIREKRRSKRASLKHAFEPTSTAASETASASNMATAKNDPARQHQPITVGAPRARSNTTVVQPISSMNNALGSSAPTRQSHRSRSAKVIANNGVAQPQLATDADLDTDNEPSWAWDELIRQLDEEEAARRRDQLYRESTSCTSKGSRRDGTQSRLNDVWWMSFEMAWDASARRGRNVRTWWDLEKHWKPNSAWDEDKADGYFGGAPSLPTKKQQEAENVPTSNFGNGEETLISSPEESGSLRKTDSRGSAKTLAANLTSQSKRPVPQAPVPGGGDSSFKRDSKPSVPPAADRSQPEASAGHTTPTSSTSSTSSISPLPEQHGQDGPDPERTLTGDIWQMWAEAERNWADEPPSRPEGAEPEKLPLPAQPGASVPERPIREKVATVRMEDTARGEPERGRSRSRTINGEEHLQRQQPQRDNPSAVPRPPPPPPPAMQEGEQRNQEFTSTTNSRPSSNRQTFDGSYPAPTSEAVHDTARSHRASHEDLRPKLRIDTEMKQPPRIAPLKLKPIPRVPPPAPAPREVPKSKVAAAWDLYERRWTELLAPSSVTSRITFASIPWPVLVAPPLPAPGVSLAAYDKFLNNALTPLDIAKFILSPEHSKGLPARERLRGAIRRWHSDKFSRFVGRMGTADGSTGEPEAIMEGVGIVARALTQLLELERME